MLHPLGGKATWRHIKQVLKMPKNCCVVGCTNYLGKKKGLRFFRFPLSNKERLRKWEAAVNRAKWKPVK